MTDMPPMAGRIGRAWPAGRPLHQRQAAGLPRQRAVHPRGQPRYYLTLVGARTNAALVTPAPFVERLVHFWANHFAVSVDKLLGRRPRRLLEFEAIRPHVLGSSRTCWSRSSSIRRCCSISIRRSRSAPTASPASVAAALRPRSAAGSTRISRARSLELHTLGVRSGYSQADVTEFARALTGWTVDGLARGPDAAPARRRAARRATSISPTRIHEPGTRTIARPHATRRRARRRRAPCCRPRRRPAHRAASRHQARPPFRRRRSAAGDGRAAGRRPSAHRRRPAHRLSRADRLARGVERRQPPSSGRPGTGRWRRCARVGTRHVEPQPAAGLITQLGQPVWRPGSPAGYDDIAAELGRRPTRCCGGSRRRSGSPRAPAARSMRARSRRAAARRARRGRPRRRSRAPRARRRALALAARLARIPEEMKMPRPPQLPRRRRGRRSRCSPRRARVRAGGDRPPLRLHHPARRRRRARHASRRPPIPPLPACAAPSPRISQAAREARRHLHPASVAGRRPAQLYGAREALFVHAVASPYRDRSHFDGQNVLETGGTARLPAAATAG